MCEPVPQVGSNIWYWLLSQTLISMHLGRWTCHFNTRDLVQIGSVRNGVNVGSFVDRPAINCWSGLRNHLPRKVPASVFGDHLKTSSSFCVNLSTRSFVFYNWQEIWVEFLCHFSIPDSSKANPCSTKFPAGRKRSERVTFPIIGVFSCLPRREVQE